LIHKQTNIFFRTLYLNGYTQKFQETLFLLLRNEENFSVFYKNISQKFFPLCKSPYKKTHVFTGF